MAMEDTTHKLKEMVTNDEVRDRLGQQKLDVI